VHDVAAEAKRAVEIGGRIVIPRQALPGGDEMAVIVDPDGIPFAIFKGTGNVPR
jgi:predicted enzyme related to lactoylglutathione lyase